MPPLPPAAERTVPAYTQDISAIVLSSPWLRLYRIIRPPLVLSQSFTDRLWWETTKTFSRRRVENLSDASVRERSSQAFAPRQLPRNRWFVDSPLEGDGFELLVRGRGEAGCRAF